MTPKEAIERLSNLYRVVLQDGLAEYNNDVRHNMAIDMAIEALKAQEPVKPKFSRVYDYEIGMYACGACGKEAGPEGMWNYCLHCGKAAKWDD